MIINIVIFVTNSKKYKKIALFSQNALYAEMEKCSKMFLKVVIKNFCLETNILHNKIYCTKNLIF